MIIPRAKISFSYGQLIDFIFSLFKKLPQDKQEELINDFERNFSLGDWQQPGVVFSQARTAFYFLLKNLDLEPGGEVIFSSLHVADFINVIRCAGFKPVIVDLDPDTCTMDYRDLAGKINNQTVLICITHLSGFAADMDKILELSKENNIPIIEDCSQAYPAYYKEKRLGKFGRAAIFSLSFLKPVCTMRGGIVLSDDTELLKKIRREKNNLLKGSSSPLISEAVKHIVYKTATQKWIFAMFVFPLIRLFLKPFDFFARYQRANKKVFLREFLPKNYFIKFNWQQAKLGLELLKKVRVREDARKERADWLHQNLNNPHVKKVMILDGSRATFWTFPVRVADIAHFKKYLLKYGIDTSAYLLSAVADELAFAPLNLKAPVTAKIKKHTLLLPMYPQLKQKEVEYMTRIINQYHAA